MHKALYQAEEVYDIPSLLPAAQFRFMSTVCTIVKFICWQPAHLAGLSLRETARLPFSACAGVSTQMAPSKPIPCALIGTRTRLDPG